jgi:hypothetical protein
MKNTTLILFALLILLGWTSLAAGVLATFNAEPHFSTRAHPHQVAPPPAAPEAPLYSGRPCPTGGDQTPDASVLCDV